MTSVGFLEALTGPLIVKLVLAAILGGAFLFLRNKETEGVMTGYAFLALLLAVRDILFAFLPLSDLYRVSDILFFILFAYVSTHPFGKGWLFKGTAAAAGIASVILALKSIFNLAPGFPSEVLREAAIFPIAAAFIIPSIRASEADTPGRQLALRARFLILSASLVYLVAGAILGPLSLVFQYAVVPLFYGMILVLSFAFTDILHKQLVTAISYYEESIDSLYELLLSAGSAVRAEFSIQEVLDNMTAVLAEKTEAEGAAILLTEEFEDAVSVRAVYGHFPPPFKLPESMPKDEERVTDYVRHARFPLGEGILGEVAKTGKQIYIPDPALDPRISRNGDEAWLHLSSFMAAPLVVRERIIGVIALERSSGEPFSERDFDRAKLLAGFGSISVANSFSFLEASEHGDIDREASIAEGIQKTVVPKKVADLPGIAFGIYSASARGVCSDYYDIIQTKPTKAILAVGDVAGKGVAAGIVMTMIRAILHLITNSAKDMSTLLSWVNRGIAGKVDSDHYATLALVSVDSSTGEAEFSNASHQPLIIYRKDSEAIETVDIKSIPIGVERATEYAAKRIRFSSGDILVMYTDGIIEAMNEQGRQFGRKNLGNTILRSRDLSAKDIAEAIHSDVFEFSGESRQHDDQTVLVMKIKL